MERLSFVNRRVSQGIEPLLAAVEAANRRFVVPKVSSTAVYEGHDRDSFEDSVDTWTQEIRRHVSHSDRDGAEEDRDVMAFDKKGGAATPPLAWVILWKGKYSNTVGEYLPESLRRWGYVMWDPARLQRTGAKEALIRDWVR